MSAAALLIAKSAESLTGKKVRNFLMMNVELLPFLMGLNMELFYQ